MSRVKSIIVGGGMKLALKLVVILVTVWAALAHAAIGEGGPMAPEPTVATGWVVVFLVAFVAVCVWIGFAIWRAEKKKK